MSTRDGEYVCERETGNGSFHPTDNSMMALLLCFPRSNYMGFLPLFGHNLLKSDLARKLRVHIQHPHNSNFTKHIYDPLALSKYLIVLQYRVDPLQNIMARLPDRTVSSRSVSIECDILIWNKHFWNRVKTFSITILMQQRLFEKLVVSYLRKKYPPTFWCRHMVSFVDCIQFG
jgi:hypothetical protein